MRKNCRTAMTAFLAGKEARPASSIWTDGETLFSYGTAIAVRGSRGRIVFNDTRYSITTTIHQNALRAALPIDVTVVGVPMGLGSARVLHDQLA